MYLHEGQEVNVEEREKVELRMYSSNIAEKLLVNWKNQ